MYASHLDKETRSGGGGGAGPGAVSASTQTRVTLHNDRLKGVLARVLMGNNSNRVVDSLARTVVCRILVVLGRRCWF